LGEDRSGNGRQNGVVQKTAQTARKTGKTERVLRRWSWRKMDQMNFKQEDRKTLAPLRRHSKCTNER
jgi:hypothetical protein